MNRDRFLADLNITSFLDKLGGGYVVLAETNHRIFGKLSILNG